MSTKQRRHRGPLFDRFFDKAVPGSSWSACWRWRGSLKARGYAKIKYLGRQYHAHRVAYELAIGPIPQGLDIDHRCRNRGCTNPLHLEAVTKYVNDMRGESFCAINARKTECPAGHRYDAANTYVRHTRLGAFRCCRKCTNAAQRRYQARLRAKRAATQ